MHLQTLWSLALGTALCTFIACGGGDDGSTVLGESCAANGDCASGLCAKVSDSEQYCSQNCDEGCPDGYRCAGNNVCFKEASSETDAGAGGTGGMGAGGMGAGGMGAGGMGAGGMGAGGMGAGGMGAGGMGAGGMGAGGMGAGGMGAGGMGAGGMGGMMTGSEGCQGFFTCAAACGQQNQPCIRACQAALTPEDQNIVQAISACAQRAMCQTTACLYENCLEVAEACFGEFVPPPVGNGDCVAILQCQNQRMCRDEACLNECLGMGTEEAQQQFAQLSLCAGQNMCMTGQCLQEHCAEEYSTCTGVMLPTGDGDQGCSEVLTCSAMCQDQACAQACQAELDQEALPLFSAFTQCASMNPGPCRQGVEACRAVCGEQIAACEADI